MSSILAPDIFLGAALVFLATALGASLVWALHRVDPRLHAALLALAAGAMGYSVLEMLAQSTQAAALPAAALFFLSGVLMMVGFDRLLPHLHADSAVGSPSGVPKRKAMLLAGSITLHNIPEGLAVGTAFASSGPLGWSVALSIALQDIPEGLLVAAPLSLYKLSTRASFALGVLSGAVEGLAALAGFLALSLISGFVPGALALSAGAMAYVVLIEMVPDILSRGRPLALLFAPVGFLLAWLVGLLFSV